MKISILGFLYYFGIFVLSENFIFSDHFDTNLVENFELEDCEFLV